MTWATFPLITVAGLYAIAAVVIIFGIVMGPCERKFLAYCKKHGIGE